MRMWIQSLALLRGLGIWRCCELWCRSKMWLGSCISVAVALACICSSDLTSSLRCPYAVVVAPKCKKKKKKSFILYIYIYMQIKLRDIPLTRGRITLYSVYNLWKGIEKIQAWIYKWIERLSECLCSTKWLKRSFRFSLLSPLCRLTTSTAQTDVLGRHQPG